MHTLNADDALALFFHGRGGRGIIAKIITMKATSAGVSGGSIFRCYFSPLLFFFVAIRPIFLSFFSPPFPLSVTLAVYIPP